jgi:hypothetical protein
MDSVKYAKIRYFLLGIIVTVGLIFILGAYQGYVGRYQVSAWGDNGIGYGAFITDTTTGETKIVYLNTGTGSAPTDRLSRPFEKIE